jgi:hypothetical protein
LEPIRRVVDPVIHAKIKAGKFEDAVRQFRIWGADEHGILAKVSTFEALMTAASEQKSHRTVIPNLLIIFVDGAQKRANTSDAGSRTLESVVGKARDIACAALVTDFEAVADVIEQTSAKGVKLNTKSKAALSSCLFAEKGNLATAIQNYTVNGFGGTMAIRREGSTAF